MTNLDSVNCEWAELEEHEEYTGDGRNLFYRVAGDLNRRFQVRVSDHAARSITELQGSGFSLPLYCHQDGQVGKQTWYGFAEHLERTVFLLLLKADGIGPVKALTFLSKTHYKTIWEAAKSEDTEAFAKMPGGPKTTEAIAKVLMKEIWGRTPKKVAKPRDQPTFVPNPDLVKSLTVMGYSLIQAKEVAALTELNNTGKPLEELVAIALRTPRKK